MNDLVNMAWVAICAALVFFMQAGFALVEGGLSRAKNSVNVIMKVYLGTCLASVAFWLSGWGLAFGPSLGGLYGIGDFALISAKPSQTIAMIYQAMFAVTAVGVPHLSLCDSGVHAGGIADIESGGVTQTHVWYE